MRLILRGIRLLLAASAIGHGLFIVAYFAARVVIGERLAAVGVMNTAMPVWLLPAFVFAPLILIFFLHDRRWLIRLLLLQLIPILAFFALYGSYFIPRAIVNAAEVDDLPQLTVLSYNISYQNHDAAAMNDFLRAVDADVVLMQEFVSWRLTRNLPPLIEDFYPHQGAKQTKGFFTRLPMLESDTWSSVHNRGQQRIVVEVDGAPVTIYNVHLSRPSFNPRSFSISQRDRQLTEVLERVEAETNDYVLVAGDFNLTDQSGAYQRLTERFTDSYRAVGRGIGMTSPDWGFFHPALAPLPAIRRIDYLFHNDNLQTVSVEVLPATGLSDHRPLLVRLALLDVGE
jgi:endonuclease/exonuclease/phosphatase (EEP) superfamily protein YafD